jgi:hypothetical protein
LPGTLKVAKCLTPGIEVLDQLAQFRMFTVVLTQGLRIAQQLIPGEKTVHVGQPLLVLMEPVQH